MFNKFIYGTAYYPELWDSETLEQDIGYMKELHINTVRINEFAWSALEPEKDKFCFDNLISTINKFYDAGINVILCTPTATPPTWIAHNHSERMFVNGDGKMNYGARQHICTNNPQFRERVGIIVTHLAEKCGKLPGVIAWQIDNEFKCNVGECYCDECEKQWHIWLAKKYKEIENLNEKWGTGVWSQRFSSFEQVPSPKPTTCCHNPSLLTNYKEFSHDKISEFLKMQVDIIRKWSDIPITHNSAVWFDVNGEKFARDLDFVSFDDYPKETDYKQIIFDCDRFRGLKSEGRFMFMETSPGYNGEVKQTANVHSHGFVSAEALASLAFGSCGLSFWHFRQHRSGCEFPHGSVISAWGEPTSCYEDVLRGGEKLNEFYPQIANTQLKPAEIALHYSDDSRRFLTTENYGEMDYINLIRRFYDVMLDAGYMRDILPIGRSPEQYKVVFTPFAYYLDDNVIADMLKYVENGGVWVVGPMTNIRTADHTVRTDSANGNLLSQAAGVHIKYFVQTNGTDMSFSYKGTECPICYWASVMESEGADFKALCKGNYIKSGGLLSENSYGKGKLIFLGAMPDDEKMLKNVIIDILDTCDISLRYESTAGVVAALRSDKQGNGTVMAVNMSEKDGTVTYCGKTVNVAPFDCAVFSADKDKEN